MKSNIYIKNFTMPENCLNCPFSKWEYCQCTCLITNKIKGDTGAYKRPKKCPLVYEKKIDN